MKKIVLMAIVAALSSLPLASLQAFDQHFYGGSGTQSGSWTVDVPGTCVIDSVGGVTSDPGGYGWARVTRAGASPVIDYSVSYYGINGATLSSQPAGTYYVQMYLSSNSGSDFIFVDFY